jgi:hypothetical protein
VELAVLVAVQLVRSAVLVEMVALEELEGLQQAEE